MSLIEQSRSSNASEVVHFDLSPIDQIRRLAVSSGILSSVQDELDCSNEFCHGSALLTLDFELSSRCTIEDLEAQAKGRQ